MKSRFLALAVLVALFVIAVMAITKNTSGSLNLNASTVVGSTAPTVTIDGKTFAVELAKTDAQKAQGLSGRTTLGENNGMLFVFDSPAVTPFWMKDMKFPLDFVWINNNQVVDITRHVPAPTIGTSPMNLPTYSPSSAVDNVLEINSSAADTFKIGDKVIINDQSSTI